MSEQQVVTRRAGWLTVVIMIAFGLFYAYDLFEALSNLVGVPAQIAEFNKFLIENDVEPQPVPWAVLVANLLLPPIAYAAAWLLGRGRGVLVQVLLFTLGLAVVAALSLTLTALV